MTNEQFIMVMASQKDILDMLATATMALKVLVVLNLATFLLWGYVSVFSDDKSPPE